MKDHLYSVKADQGVKRSYWYMQGEYEQDESRSDAAGDQAYVSAMHFQHMVWLNCKLV